MKFLDMIQSLQLLIRHEISMIRGKFFGLPSDWGRMLHGISKKVVPYGVT